jgi:hypothetical protein
MPEAPEATVREQILRTVWIAAATRSLARWSGSGPA